jgi:hypothetical protein
MTEQTSAVTVSTPSTFSSFAGKDRRTAYQYQKTDSLNKMKKG